jgi:hypothetical protein
MQGERPTVHPSDSYQRSVGVSDENEKNITPSIKGFLQKDVEIVFKFRCIYTLRNV